MKNEKGLMAASSLFERVKEINSIIERDATDTSYKYALLRGVAEVCQNYSHFKEEENGRIYLPTGLLVERWLLYYYPIVASPQFIPQKGNEKPLEYKQRNIAFRKQFTKIIAYYQDKGGFSVFYNDYRTGNIAQEIRKDLRLLVRIILFTITRYPMKHLGYSLNRRHYSIFSYEPGGRIEEEKVSPEHLIERCGRFSLDKDLFKVFRDFGGYLAGNNSVISKWAEFSTRANRNIGVDLEKALMVLNEYPISERDIAEAKNFYSSLLKTRGFLECVWSGRRITDPNYLHIDHVIPFSIWKNNDLWNLMPADRGVNLMKRDRIPSQAILSKRRHALQAYWKALLDEYPERFASEVRIALTGRSHPDSILIAEAFLKLDEKRRFLVENQGYPEWNP